MKNIAVTYLAKDYLHIIFLLDHLLFVFMEQIVMIQRFNLSS